ncbi:MAG: DNA-3-methyladenine glycosylase 2 family protein, partial [Planctomycetota bacterium]|nr:DNA-3-methyladenine glycosylase 2 family protein [Planctomycetota bacterium]
MKPTVNEIRALKKRDPILGNAMGRLEPFPGFPSPSQKRSSTFAYLVRAIVFQQLAYKAADTIWRRVLDLCQESGKMEPTALANISDQALRGAGLSRAKLAAVRDLSQRVLDGRLKLRGLSRLKDCDVLERLVKVKGIGPWTAQMFLIFKLGRLDVMPTTDLGVQEGLRRLDSLNERPSPKEVQARAEKWSPLCSVAAWY